jgi:hypothetical protein
MEAFVQGPLLRTFPGLSKDKFLDKLIKHYKFGIDKTYMSASGLMLRLPKNATAPFIPSATSQ